LLNQSVTHNTSTPSNLDWTQFGATFIATGPSATLMFTETTGGTNAGVLLDAVAVNGATAVSEPASLAMIGLGLAGVGFVRRKGILKFPGHC
jgi:PEP-CTERM motif